MSDTQNRKTQTPEALKEDEPRLHVLMDHLPMPIQGYGPDGIVTYWNRASEQLYGFTAGEAIGRNLGELIIPPAIQPHFQKALEASRTLTESGEFLPAGEVELRRKDGSPVHVYSTHTAICSPGRPPALFCLDMDLTEHNRAQEELQRVNRALKARSESNQALLRTRSETEYLQEVCRIVMEDCGHAMVWVGFAEENEAKSVRPVVSAGFEEGYLDTLNVTWADTERGRGPTGTAIRTGTVCRCLNMLTDPKFLPWREQAVRRGYASSIALPLMNEGRAFGALTIYSRKPVGFTDGEVHLLTELAGDFARGIITLRLRAAKEQAEESLRRSEASWNAAIENFGEGAIIATEAEQVIYWNPAARAMHGFTSEREGIGPLEKTPETFQLWTPDGSRMLPLDEWPMRRIKRGEILRGLELRLRRPDQGWERVVSYSGAMVEIVGGERLIFLSVHDLTDQRKAEAALRESETRLRLALDAAHFGMWDWDVATGNVVWNEEHYRMLGYEPGSFSPTYRHWADRVHPEDLPGAEAAIRRVMEEGGDYVSEFRVCLPDGTVRQLEARGRFDRDKTGKAVRNYGVMVDVTERKKAEEALRRSEERFKVIASSTPDHILVQDRDLRYTFVVNPQIGLTERDMIGKTDHDFLAKDDADKLVKIKRQVLETGIPIHVEMPLASPGHEPQFFSGSYVPKHDGAGQIDGLIGYFSNITARRQAEDELRRRLEELRIANEELARFNRVAVDRELRMVQLKKQVNELCVKAGIPLPYPLAFDREPG